MKTIRLYYERSDGKSRTVHLPSEIAWACARAVAKSCYSPCFLAGEFGIARITIDGSGWVEWNEKSTEPGERTSFDSSTVVCI